MKKFVWTGAAALLASLTVGLGAANAFGVQKVYEDNVTGYVGAIPTSSPAIMVGSDGESSFDPFGAGFDTSDGIVLNGNWAPDPAYAAAFAPGFWTQLPGTSTWVLPACNPSGCENADIVEPVAKWDFTGGSGWLPGTKSLLILDPNGAFSDFVKVANDGPNGEATILFVSGQHDIPVPEPSLWALLMTGLAGVGAAMRRRRERAFALLG